MTPKFRAICNLTRGWQRWPPAKRSGSGREVTESSSLLCKRPRAPRCQILPPTETGRPRRPENRGKQTPTVQRLGEQGIPCSRAPAWVFCGDFLRKAPTSSSSSAHTAGRSRLPRCWSAGRVSRPRQAARGRQHFAPRHPP